MTKLSLLLILPFTFLFSQTSYNVTVFGQMDKYTGGIGDNDYSEVWGWTDTVKHREYAFIGSTLGTSIVDITTLPLKEVSFHVGPPSTYNYQEFRTYKQYLYVGSEGSDLTKNAGVLVIDLSTLPDSSTLKKIVVWVDTNSVTGTRTNYYRTHTVSIEKNFLYLNGGNYSGTRILDIIDPLNPKQVGSYKSISNFPYVHDSYVRNDTLYAACIDNGSIDIVDFTKKGNYTQSTASKVVSITTTVPEKRTHQVWISEDGNYMFVATETSGGHLHIYDISNRALPIQIATWTSNPATSIHNVFVKGDFLYIANYKDGFRVLDIKNPANPIEVAFYDTYPIDNATADLYKGAWGVYPYFPSGKIAVSDMNTGLYIFNVDYKRGGNVTGVVRDGITNQLLDSVEVTVIEMGRKNLTAIGTGRYTYGSAEGLHTIKFSKKGYTTRTESFTTRAGKFDTLNITLSPNGTTEIISQHKELPQQFDLAQNFPNPFNPNTNISFSIPVGNYTTLRVYNSLGQLAATIINQYLSSGTYSVMFDVHQFQSDLSSEGEYSSGVYFYTIHSGSFSFTKKMVLSK